MIGARAQASIFRNYFIVIMVLWFATLSYKVSFLRHKNTQLNTAYEYCCYKIEATKL